VRSGWPRLLELALMAHPDCAPISRRGQRGSCRCFGPIPTRIFHTSVVSERALGQTPPRAKGSKHPPGRHSVMQTPSSPLAPPYSSLNRHS